MNEKITGLSEEEVQQRINQGKVNTAVSHTTKTYGQIFKSNTLTFFNLINIILVVCVFLVGSYKNALFIGTVIMNTIVGIIQEINAKRTLDKLKIIVQSKVDVIRAGKTTSIATDQIVLDDIVILKSGMQIPVDCQIQEGLVEVNESLLTGESVPQTRKENDSLYSGSIITAGEATCKVIHVGKDNYSAKIVGEAKKFKRSESELRNSIDKIIKIVSCIIVPLGIILFLVQYFNASISTQEAVVNTVAALVGMIPEGLVFLTSVALAISVVRLSKVNTLVQDLFCVETLARVDTLCLDKTGTITEGKMKVKQVLKLTTDNLEEIMGNYLNNTKDDNATALAIRDYFKEDSSYQVEDILAFSSDRKFSAIQFKDKGTYYFGASTFIVQDIELKLKAMIDDYGNKGNRVLLIAHSDSPINKTPLTETIKPIGLLIIADSVRQNAKVTLDYFADQGVELKVISGDDPHTVSSIAAEAGLKNAENFVDAETLDTPEKLQAAISKYTVFGRVKPDQKKAMVIALKEAGKTVAMTGDGVNDVPALKQANVSVAMASGSDAAKNASNIVLLTSDFASLPFVLKEGRRVINNINKASSMFLVKTVFSFLLTLLVILFQLTYPFQPIDLTIISAFAVGIPTFLLQFEPSFEKVSGHFLSKAFFKAIPSSLTIVVVSLLIMLVGNLTNATASQQSTLQVMLTGFIYIYTLVRVYWPLSTYRKSVIGLMLVGLCVSCFVFNKLLDLTWPTLIQWLFAIVMMVIVPCMIKLFEKFYKTIEGKVVSIASKIKA